MSELSIGELVRPVEVFHQHALLSSALPSLARGRPVVVHHRGEHFLLLPSAAAGQRPTRRLDDLPLAPTTPVPFETPLLSALEQTAPDAMPYVAVARDDEIVGVVSRTALVERAAEESLAGTTPRDRLVLLGEFAGAIAHDFNNLLTITLGRAALLERELEDGSAAHQHVREIGDATSRAAALVRQLLAFGSRELVRPVTLDLRAMLLSLQALLDRLLGEDIELIFEVAGDLWPISADPRQIERILTNLVVNARHAMPDGGTLTIRVRNLDGARRRIRISVADTGVGIAPDVLPRIFEPYFTTRADRGSGLGLATVHGTVAQLGGEIAVESSPGKGARFEIDLDVATPTAEDRLESLSSDPPAVEGTTRVLVVEDDPLVARSLARVLEMLDHEAQVAPTLEAARAAFEGPGPLPELVITDLILRRGRGTELLGWLRARHPEVPCIVSSGYIGDVEPDERIGDADAVLPKPYSVEQLRAAIARAFQARRRR